MTNRSNRLHNSLNQSEPDPLDKYLDKAEKEADLETPQKKGGSMKTIVLFTVIFAMGFFMIEGFNSPFSPATMFSEITNTAGPSEDLLTRMGNPMEEMGYTGLTNDDLRELRSKGVTATYISNVRTLGYTDLTLDQAVRLASADASSAFIAMMIELGYTLEVDEIINLRQAGVTAYYTSNIHDLGYRDVSIDQLIRMRRIGVTPDLIKQLQEERGESVELEEIIRYRISNQ